jgi:hypothetical protein
MRMWPHPSINGDVPADHLLLTAAIEWRAAAIVRTPRAAPRAAAPRAAPPVARHESPPHESAARRPTEEST